ncbi:MULTISPECIES: hypothetical protein [Halomonas]|uniref:Uncharacterized protein n=1 Tax=Halomonas ventosae TaxID=229007 RepID=A0A4R6I037_9GAMM|nr:hypothetical protein [Halomonas ventosae]TDO15213.1 hypothetical protein DFO68_10244 [Halomonas ventosae]
MLRALVKVLRAAKAEGGQLLDDVTPAQGAEAILKLLRDEGVLPP